MAKEIEEDGDDSTDKKRRANDGVWNTHQEFTAHYDDGKLLHWHRRMGHFVSQSAAIVKEWHVRSLDLMAYGSRKKDFSQKNVCPFWLKKNVLLVKKHITLILRNPF